MYPDQCIGPAALIASPVRRRGPPPSPPFISSEISVCVSRIFNLFIDPCIGPAALIASPVPAGEDEATPPLFHVK